MPTMTLGWWTPRADDTYNPNINSVEAKEKRPSAVGLAMPPDEDVVVRTLATLWHGVPISRSLIVS
jgi:hypothetical protein